MKNSPNPVTGVIQRGFRHFSQRTTAFFRRSGKRFWLLHLTALIPAVVLILSGADPRILAAVQQPANQPVHHTAEWVSEFGEFQYSTLAVAAVTGLMAWGFRSRKLRGAAVAVLVAGILGGVLVNVCRPTFGRARPHQEEDGRFTWFRMNSRYQGFPSGHTSSTTSSMVALAVTCPPMAIPAVGCSIAVGWSRMQLNRHYLSDVMGGLVLGSICGFWGAAVARTREDGQKDVDGTAEEP